MKVKNIAQQLLEMGFKTGDRINIQGWEGNPHRLDLEYNRLLSNRLCEYSIESLRDKEFEKILPTKEELIEELKKRSKKIEDDEECFYICWIYGRVGYSERGTSRYINELYFDEHTAAQVCDELNADKEKIKILFELENC